MTFWEHLEELRWRVMKMAIAFLIGAVTAWFFREEILTWLTLPFVEGWAAGNLDRQASLHFSAPAAMFLANIKIAVLSGLLFALPIMLYQVWAFVAPGLYSNERRLAIPFVVSSCTLFACGALFGWKIVFPAAFRYLLHFAGPVGGSGFEVMPTVMVDDYLDFVTRMLLAFGITFQLPVLVLFLSIARIVNYRHLIRFGRYFIVIAFVLGAVLTPPDVTSQVLLALPLLVLYGLSVGLSYLITRKHVKELDRRAAAGEAEEAPDSER